MYTSGINVQNGSPQGASGSIDLFNTAASNVAFETSEDGLGIDMAIGSKNDKLYLI